MTCVKYHIIANFFNMKYILDADVLLLLVQRCGFKTKSVKLEEEKID